MVQWQWLLAALLAVFTGTASAAWQLDAEASELSIVSIKAGDIAEAHRFEGLDGTVTDDGQVELRIDLASLDTGIAVRDERMRELFFETARYPQARLVAQVPAALLSALTPGNSRTVSVTASLSLKEAELPVTLELLATGLAGGDVLVVNRGPVIIDAGRFGLAEAVERLRQIAGLPSISLAVPVSAALRFRADAPEAGEAAPAMESSGRG